MSGRKSNQFSELSKYFKSVSRVQMMTPDEEAEVARNWQSGKDQRFADRLVSANLRFVIKIAMEYKNYGFPVLDLIQEGNLGLVRAVQSFDPEKGYRLISYGVWWIRAYIQEYILKNWSLVKIGTTQLQRRLFNHLQSSQKRLSRLMKYDSEYQRREALAESVGGSVRDVEEMERRMYGRDLSIDMPQGSDEDGTFNLHEKMASNMDNAEDLVEAREMNALKNEELTRALETLEGRERFIVISRHLADKTVTLRELGERLGISKERVRQLESRALKTLRSNLAASENIEQVLSM